MPPRLLRRAAGVHPPRLLTRAAGVPPRILLAGEIVGAYASARRELGRAPLDAAVARMRSRGSAAGCAREQQAQSCEHLARAVVRTLALVPGDTRCLVRSLVLTRVLARRGIAAKLVIGTRSAPEFQAHAWVEHAGRPVLAPGAGFRRLLEL